MKFCRPIFFALLFCLVFPLMASADPLEDAKAAIENKDFSRAHELLLPLVEAKNVEALALLDALHGNGQVSDEAYNKGLSVIMKAAQKGFKPARLSAFKSCLNLANQGDTAAMFNVGYMCLNDWGGAHDNAVCLKWLENAAKLGHEKSSKYLTKIYTEGKYGVTPDEEKAAYWKNLGESFAAGIDGEWKGSLDMGTGGPPMEYAFDFKMDGDTLKGTSSGFGGKTPITNGTFDGTNVSFAVQTEFMGRKTTTSYTGTFYGDTLMLTSQTKTKSSGNLHASKTIKKNAGGEELPPVTFTVKRAE